MSRLLIFDMDGTIADTSPGIYASYRHVARELNVECPSDAELNGIIGGSLPSNIKRIFNLGDDLVSDAVRIYRDYYSVRGYLGSVMYDGILQVMQELKKRGYTLAVATMKAQTFAERLLEMWNISDYFSLVFGVDYRDTMTKDEMIKNCMLKTKTRSEDTYMIGDSRQDRQAAELSGVNFLAVTYGFYYSEELCREMNLDYITSPTKLLDKFI